MKTTRLALLSLILLMVACSENTLDISCTPEQAPAAAESFARCMDGIWGTSRGCALASAAIHCP